MGSNIAGLLEGAQRGLLLAELAKENLVLRPQLSGVDETLRPFWLSASPAFPPLSIDLFDGSSKQPSNSSMLAVQWSRRC